MKETFRTINFRETTCDIIEYANVIVEEYQHKGLDLTLRQLYYQFVARGLIENSQRSYKKLGDTISNARLAGLLDWEAIVDRTRNLQKNAHWQDPAEIIQTAANSYRIDKWADQDNRVEVWIEKEALIGVIERICKNLDVPFFACKGYVSQSEQWRAGHRFRGYSQRGQTPVLIHLGDHDPSGIDMTRDNEERLNMFCGEYFEVERIALNMDQVLEHDPPPNPAKITDSRFKSYVREHGEDSYELDALEPTVLRDLIEEKVIGYRDDDKWNAMVEKEEDERATLTKLADKYGIFTEVMDEIDPYEEEDE